MNQQLTIGRIVHAYVDPRSNNGADLAPAIITRVWGSGELSHDNPLCPVNMRLQLDHSSNDPATNEWRSSAQVFVDREAADRFLTGVAEQNYPEGVDDFEAQRAASILARRKSGMVAFMPPRV